MATKSHNSIYRYQYCSRTPVCARCNEAFKEGDRTVHRSSKTVRVFHEKCWEQMLIE